MTALALYEAPPVDYGEAEADMVRYREAGTARALALDNRGPLRFGPDGALDPAILESYWRHGFYVFEGVLGPEELADIERDLADLLDRAPASPGAETDRRGRPAFDYGRKGRGLGWVKPLSDPVGGTDYAYGRHPAKMAEPDAPEGAPSHVLQLIHGSLQYSEACLRLYGHPGLLKVAEAVNGSDFTPFNEAVWIKHPRLGGSVAWHQDGWTHWDSPELDEGSHGFNFMAQLYGCDAVNGLWVVPGSHSGGRADIRAMVAAAGSDRLPEAVPLICAPGDVVIVNRQALHGSFANTGSKPRVTLNMGFHRRRSVLDVETGGVHNPVSVYDADYIRRRARLILYAIDARRQRWPDEEPYRYAPLVDEAENYRWTPATAENIRDYNLEDIGI